VVSGQLLVVSTANQDLCKKSNLNIYRIKNPKFKIQNPKSKSPKPFVKTWDPLQQTIALGSHSYGAKVPLPNNIYA
jgi:hypothetical protein